MLGHCGCDYTAGAFKKKKEPGIEPGGDCVSGHCGCDYTAGAFKKKNRSLGLNPRATVCQVIVVATTQLAPLKKKRSLGLNPGATVYRVIVVATTEMAPLKKKKKGAWD